jgi:hypothetical protein
MATQRALAQIPANAGYYRTIVNTMWLYPMVDIEIAMKSTTYKYTFDGTNIVCPDMTNLLGLYTDIYEQTSESQPVGNRGYTLGVGTIVQNFGKAIYWQLPGGQVIIKWRLVKQLTPQTTDYIPAPGNSVDDTVGFITVFNTEGYNNILDASYLVIQG